MQNINENDLLLIIRALTPIVQDKKHPEQKQFLETCKKVEREFIKTELGQQIKKTFKRLGED